MSEPLTGRQLWAAISAVEDVPNWPSDGYFACSRFEDELRDAGAGVEALVAGLATRNPQMPREEIEFAVWLAI
jgi:hypothetical protein